MRPLPDTSCMTWASDTFSPPMTMPASPATRIAVSTIVSRSASSTRRRLVGAVAVTGVGPLPQQDAPVRAQQEDDVHDDPATWRYVGSDRMSPALPIVIASPRPPSTQT